MTVREVFRTGEDSREETTELEMDAGAEAVGRLGTSLGTWDMAWVWALTVAGDASVTSPSLADRCAGSEAASASLSSLDDPEVPFR